MARQDESLLQAALLGYQAEHSRITAAISAIQKRLGGSASASTGSANGSAPVPRKKHRISAEGRARIAEAQRKRWAAAKRKNK